MAKPDLSGVYLKLGRAEAHIEAVRNQLASFRETDPPPFGFRTETTAGSGEAVEYDLYAIVRQLPPRALALSIGDALHNMRSALDHLIHELAPPRSRKSRLLQFPIFVDECEFKVRSPPMIKGIKDDNRTFIERVQPHCASYPPADDPLAILRKLSNLDKHKLLVPMIAAVSHHESWVEFGNAEVAWRFIHKGPVEHDTKIVAFTAIPDGTPYANSPYGTPTVKMYVEPRSGLQVQLNETGAVRLVDIEAVDLLDMLHRHIRYSMIGMWFEHGIMPRTWADLHPVQ